MSKGRLISFEGLDGAGKTTQMQLLEQWLAARDIPYIRTREPGGTPLGVEIRHLLLNRPDLAITPLADDTAPASSEFRPPCSASSTQTVRYFGDYELLEEIGRLWIGKCRMCDSSTWGEGNSRQLFPRLIH